ncbi:hypothetical protein [Halovenus marina]|uniref:hypothetical protein n=1 Tax=Halovenus marina TaxID=3396621 RepID=UPI003F56330E
MTDSDPYERPDYLVQEFQESKGTGDEDTFPYDLNIVINGLAEQNQTMAERVEKIKKAEIDHPVFEALPKLKSWYINDDFRGGANPAKDDLEDAMNAFDKSGWSTSAYICLLQKCKLLADVPGQDLESDLNRLLNLVLAHESTLSHPESIEIPNYLNSSHIYQLFDLIEDEMGQVSDESKLHALELASFGAFKFGHQGRYMVERNWLEHYINLAKTQNRDEDTLTGYDRLLESYESSVKEADQYNLKATFLHDALLDAQEILTTEEQKQLTGRIQAYEKESVDAGEYGVHEETIEREQLQGLIDTFDDRFKTTRSRISAQAALWNSATWNEFFPSPNHITESEPGISDILSRRITDSEYNPISKTEGGVEGIKDNVPFAYTAELQLNDQLLSECLRTRVDDGTLDTEDFYGVIQSIPGLSQDDIKFLESAVDYYYEGKYDASYHIAITRFEGVTKRALQSRGEVTNALKPDDSIEQRGLEGLLDDILIDRDPFLGYYIKYKYSNKQGQNLRNRSAHSQMFYAEMNPSNAILVLYDVLRTGIRIKHSFGQ